MAIRKQYSKESLINRYWVRIQEQVFPKIYYR
ncbi:hypothetical protein SAMN05216325_1104 [Nitrosomonas marina]|uniref:Uncharacterized protein n=1 Tax=Nitrosomonas marina TaxID=917 RepID=A0A1H8EJZ0_9PROT|nr:hypothetical protein SAMN05216325_1104 [Nitrosomonas marina]